MALPPAVDPGGQTGPPTSSIPPVPRPEPGPWAEGHVPLPAGHGRRRIIGAAVAGVIAVIVIGAVMAAMLIGSPDDGLGSEGAGPIHSTVVTSAAPGLFETPIGVRIEVPDGALLPSADGSERSVELTARQVRAPADATPPAGSSLSPFVYELGPSNPGFTAPVVVSLAIPDGIDSASIGGLVVLDTQAKMWRPVSSWVDPGAGAVSALTTAFSFWTIWYRGQQQLRDWQGANGAIVQITVDGATDYPERLFGTAPMRHRIARTGYGLAILEADVSAGPLAEEVARSYLPFDGRLTAWVEGSGRSTVEHWVPAGSYEMREVWFVSEHNPGNPLYAPVWGCASRPVAQLDLVPGERSVWSSPEGGLAANQGWEPWCPEPSWPGRAHGDRGRSGRESGDGVDDTSVGTSEDDADDETSETSETSETPGTDDWVPGEREDPAASSPPGAPSIVETETPAEHEQGFLEILVRPPTDEGDRAVEGYEVECTGHGGVSGQVRIGSGARRGGATDIVYVADLTDGGSYDCRARAWSAAGWSAWSSPSVGRILYGPSEAEVTDLVVTAHGDETASITGTVTAVADPRYRPLPVQRWGLQCVHEETGFVAEATAGSAQVRLDGLVYTGWYRCHARVDNGRGWGEWSPGGLRIAVTWPPWPPSSLTVSAVGTTATVTLVDPLQDGGAPIDTYEARCDASGQAMRTGQSSSRTVQVHGLTPGATYFCSARVRNAVGDWSNWSHDMPVVVPAATTTAPPTTVPPATQPPATAPPATQPPATAPPSSGDPCDLCPPGMSEEAIRCRIECEAIGN